MTESPWFGSVQRQIRTPLSNRHNCPHDGFAIQWRVTAIMISMEILLPASTSFQKEIIGGRRAVLASERLATTALAGAASPLPRE
ncbi:MAG: hypothetical protein NVSMB6_14860 [Burkholderiaceae bacterium]